MHAQRPGEILIVDGDDNFLSNARTTLTQCNHTVTTCTTALEARHHLQRTPFDVVLCGWKLPDEDSAAFCDFIKTNPELPHVTVGMLIDPNAIDVWNKQLFRRGSETQKHAAPDELISQNIVLQELCVRVQSLLQIHRYRQELDNGLQCMMTMAEGVEEQDKRARGHCKRLAIMCIELGSVLGLEEWQLTALERAAYLHDVGKVSIPGAIISKAESLTPREMEIIQEHCVLGERLCQPMVALRPVLPIIRNHHERANGTGYPDGLHGEAIPVLAQVFAIPDIYDALRIWRPYRTSMDELQAVALMRQEVAQGFWNTHIFDAFISQVLPGLDERLDSAHVLWPMVSIA